MKKGKIKIIAEIKEAFKDVDLDDGIGLSEADALDSYADGKLRRECRQNDEKNDWRVISSADLNKYNSSLSYFDAKGMQFHLPAFLIADINGQYMYGMSFVLTYLSDYSKSQFELLSKRQREVVRSFLEFILDIPDYEFDKPEIKKAIEGYWAE